MLWYICLAVASALMLCAGLLLFSRKRGMLRYLLVLLCSVIGAYVIYIPQFFLQYDPIAATVGSLINVVAIVSQNADYLGFCRMIGQYMGDGFGAGAYEVVLAITHMMLSAVVAMTALTVIWRCFGQIRLYFMRRSGGELHVFSCVNRYAQLLAADIRNCRKKSKILFLEADPEQKHTGLCYRLGCKVLNESIEKVQAKAARRKVHYYCIGQDQEENLSNALTLLDQLQSKSPQVQRNNRVYLFSQAPLVKEMVDSAQKGLVNIDVIDGYQTAVYQLLENYPLTDAVQENRLQVLLWGFGPVNRQMLRAVSWMGQLADVRLEIQVVCKGSEDEIADFQASYPGLFTDRYHIRFHICQNRQQQTDVLKEFCRQANYIVAEGATEAETVEQAVFLRRAFYRMDETFQNCPRIFAYMENDEKAQVLQALCTAEIQPERRVNYEIIPFGMTTQVYTFEQVTDSKLDRLAKNVHLVYEDVYSDGKPDIQEALRRYNLFEVNKRSNRANAMHIRSKLRMLGLDYTDSAGGETVELKDYLTEAALDKLIRAEHNRWMAFMESEGWTEATIRQAQDYQASGLSRGRHNCPLLKMHPYICPFEKLAEYAQVLGLPDSTAYDRELIARIPDILRDKWGVTGLHYRIVKWETD